MLPPMLPHIRMDRVSFEDRDNFVRNLVTVLLRGGAWERWPTGGVGGGPILPAPLTKSAVGRAVVVDLPAIKLYCRVDNPDEDGLLTNLEMAARLHTENILERTIDATDGENIKQAVLMLIDHWYRNRAAVLATGAVANLMPLGYAPLLSPERNYTHY